MAVLPKISRLAAGVQRGISLANNEILVNNIQIKGGSGSDTEYVTFDGSSLTGVRTITLPDTNLDLAHIADLVSLSGVAAGSANLGTFTGSIIPDSQTIKAALQALETSLETTAGNAEFVDDTFRIQDELDATKKIAFQASGIATATTRTVTMPNTDVDLGSIATNASDITDLQTDVDDLVILSGVAANAEDLGTFTGSIIPDSQTIKEALQALESEIEAIPDPIFYAGTWDATANSPDLDLAGARVQGALYRVTVAGTHDFLTFGGSITFNVGDKVVYNGTAWEKWDVSDEVTSVNSQSGDVILEANDIDVAAGYAAAAGTVAAADTIQVALQKLDGNAAAAQSDIDNHIANAVGAHAASAISNTPAGNLAATEVQAALNELQGDIDGLNTAISNISQESIVRIADAGETLAAGVKAVRWAKAADAGFVAGRLYLADNNAVSVDNFHVVGLLVATGELAGVSVTATKAGKLTATAHGFTVGQPIYLGAAGILTSTPPSADDLAVVKVGMAEDANTIDVAIQIMGVV
jgi:hypothetical protein